MKIVYNPVQNKKLQQISTADDFSDDFEPKNANIQQHISSTSNPHSVTKTQVGLDNVNNSNTTNGMWESDGTNTKLKIADDIDFAKYKAIAMACDNGATLPDSPVQGQWFLHTPTGRRWLMQYAGSAWNAVIAFGASTLYVDYALGTDNQNKGYGSGANAFKTIQYAQNSIPGIYTGNVTVYLSRGTHTVTTPITFRSKNPLGSYSITYAGSFTSFVNDFTADTYSQGSGSTHGRITKSGAGWSNMEGLQLYCVSGANVGRYFVIDKSTSDTIDIVGYFTSAPQVGDVYKVLDYAAVISSTNNSSILWCTQISGLSFWGVKMVTGGNTVASIQNYVSVTFNSCMLENTATSAVHYMFNLQNYGQVSLNRSVLKVNSDMSYAMFSYLSSIFMQGSMIFSSALTRSSAVGLSTGFSGFYAYNGFIIRNFATGVNAGGNSNINAGAPATVKDCNTGVAGVFTGVINQYAFNFVNVTTNRNENNAIYGRVGVYGNSNNIQSLVRGNSTQTVNLQEWQNSSGVQLAYITPLGGAVFNETGANTDFRVEGDTDINLLFIDASADKVGIGKNNPAYKLDVTGEVNATSGYRVNGTAGVSGTFTSADSKTITVTNGIITSIV